VPFPKTHDLEKLIKLLPSDISLPPSLRTIKDISKFSEAGRYPHGFEDVSPEDYRHAVKQAKAVMEWVEKLLGQEGPSGAHESPALYKTRKPRLKPLKKK
jgi:HEPN domain-containing protein